LFAENNRIKEILMI